MSNTEQLEREAEQTRLALAGTMEQLRARVTPGHVVDQLVDYAQQGDGGEFFANLRRQAVNNPLPITLIGAGLAWLMLTRRTAVDDASAAQRVMPDAGDLAERGRHSAAGVAGSARQAATTIGEAAREVRDRAADATQASASTIKNIASSTYQAAAATAETVADSATRSTSTMSESAGAIRQNAVLSARSLTEFCRDQPLMVAGIGVALGAALGAIFPSTSAEDRVMGKASDEAKQKVQAAATEACDKAERGGERALEAAEDDARKQGSAVESLVGEPGAASTEDASVASSASPGGSMRH